MKRIILSLLLLGLALGAADQSLARGRRDRDRDRDGDHDRGHDRDKDRRRGHRDRHRTTVVVRHGFPLQRTLPAVVIHPARRSVRVVTVAYLPPVVWAPRVVALPDRRVIKWEDSETIDREDDWAEFTLNADAQGTRLFLEMRGEAELNFAEVVFHNGDAQVVDLGERPLEPGIYMLLDFKDGRRVDHVRVVARARTDEAKFILRMENPGRG